MYIMYTIVFSNYLDNRSMHERDRNNRRYVEEYRNDFSDVDDHRDYEKSHGHHHSKSSGRSKRNSHKRKHKKHHHSHSVCACLSTVNKNLY